MKLKIKKPSLSTIVGGACVGVVTAALVTKLLLSPINTGFYPLNINNDGIPDYYLETRIGRLFPEITRTIYVSYNHNGKTRYIQGEVDDVLYHLIKNKIEQDKSNQDKEDGAIRI